MGREAACRARYEGRTFEGRALLETDVVVFRTQGLRVQVPIAAVSSAEANDGWLRLVWGSDAIELELGTQAQIWAERIRNPRTLMDKLGVKPGSLVSVVGLDDPDLLAELERRGAEVTTGRTVRASDLILFRADTVR